MKAHNRTRRFFLLASLGLAMAVSGVVLSRQSYGDALVTKQDTVNKHKQSPKEGDAPVTSYTAPEPTDPAVRDMRRAKNSQYDKRRPQPLSELTGGIEELPLVTHWELGLPALPSAQSDAIVLGEVTGAQAYLSNDKTGVYSEFTVRIVEVLKNPQDFPLIPMEAIVVKREGGAVRFPSGRVQHYRIIHQGMPKVGRKYLLFLRYPEQMQDLTILTGFELREDRVLPLDDLDRFAVYKSTNSSGFLDEVRESISRTSQVQKRGGDR
jgi:hypothetical protein